MQRSLIGRNAFDEKLDALCRCLQEAHSRTLQVGAPWPPVKGTPVWTGKPEDHEVQGQNEETYIRYASRRACAEMRPKIKGRFAKAPATSQPSPELPHRPDNTLQFSCFRR